MLQYFDGLSSNCDGNPLSAELLKAPSTVHQLSKVLRTAGIDIRQLDRSAENAMRLAVVASLVETLEPSRLRTNKKRVVAGLPKWRLNRVQAYIDANIGGSISLADLSATAGLTRMHFARQFRAATGVRPHDYVLRRRIARAQQMLALTKEHVIDIALNVGFKTQAHFTTVFKKLVGSTPYRWRLERLNVE